jgi:hypothetical protein
MNKNMDIPQDTRQSLKSQCDAHTTRHLTTRHLTAHHLTTRHFSTCHSDNSPPWQLATLTTRHSDNSPPDNSLLWQLATMITRHPDNSPLWQLSTWQLATMTTCHYDNSPPWQLATIATHHHGVYAWISLSILIIFYFNVCAVLLPGFFSQYFADFLFWSMRSNIYYFILIM